MPGKFGKGYGSTKGTSKGRGGKPLDTDIKDWAEKIIATQHSNPKALDPNIFKARNTGSTRDSSKGRGGKPLDISGPNLGPPYPGPKLSPKSGRGEHYYPSGPKLGPPYSGPSSNSSSGGSGNSGGYSSGGGSSGDAPIGAIDSILAPISPAINPYDASYDALIAFARKMGPENLAELAKLKATIDPQYEQAEKGMYDQYQNSRATLDTEARNLGVDPSQMYHGYDATLRGIQENSDQSQAQDKSWFDKMTSLRSVELDNLYIGLSQEKVVQMANWAIAQAQRELEAQQTLEASQGISSSGGYGGGGGRGGSSGGGSISQTETATETQTNNDPDYAINMAGLTPDQQAIYAANSNLTGTNELAKLAQQQYNAAVNTKIPSIKYNTTGLDAPGEWLSKAIAKASEKRKKKAISDAAAVKRASTNKGGSQGISEKTTKLVKSGKQKTKIKAV